MSEKEIIHIILISLVTFCFGFRFGMLFIEHQNTKKDDK